MRLSTEDAGLFYKLMYALQFFANERLKILPDVTNLDDYIDLPPARRVAVRDALFSDRTLIDTFVSRNPARFTDNELAAVSAWKKGIMGDFYLERMLKKHAIFIGDKEDVYGVHALYDSFDEMFPKQSLPLLVKCLILPFKGRIIYDGILQSYNIHFGGGIRRRLREVYMRAKQNAAIIEALDEKAALPKPPPPEKPSQDWTPILDDLADRAKNLKGGAGQPPVNSPVFSLIKASLELGQLALSNPDDPEGLWKQVKKAERSLNKVAKVLHRMV